MKTSEQIKETNAFKGMDATIGRFYLSKTNIQTINQSLVLIKNIGLEKWEQMSQGMRPITMSIVKELNQNL